jgi:hypothetical protein
VVSQARVVLNQQALGELDRGLATGLEVLAMEVLRVVKPPDATPFGVGLVDRGGAIAYVDGKKVGGSAPDVKKPKAMRVRGKGVVVGVGFGFPGRFQEVGTSHQPSRPFLTPAVMSVVKNDGAVIGALRTALAGALAQRRRRLIRHSL